jgi:hypothetical protein
MPGEPPSGDAPPFNNGRETDGSGRFARGNKASSGRPLGARDKATRMLDKLMADKLMADNTKAIAEKPVAAAKNGEHWAVTLALKDMLPRRPRLIDGATGLPAMATVEEAAQRIAAINARMEAGALGVDEAQALIAGHGVSPKASCGSIHKCMSCSRLSLGTNSSQSKQNVVASTPSLTRRQCHRPACPVRKPVSSSVSRIAAASALSPGLILPPGKPHLPA